MHYVHLEAIRFITFKSKFIKTRSVLLAFSLKFWFILERILLLQDVQQAVGVMREILKVNMGVIMNVLEEENLIQGDERVGEARQHYLKS